MQIGTLTSRAIIVTSLLFIAILAVLQGVMSIPWMYALELIDFNQSDAQRRRSFGLIGQIIGGCALILTPVLWLGGSDTLARFYGTILQIQIIMGIGLLAPIALGIIWPKGASIAFATQREATRQPLFWLILSGGLLVLVVSLVLPYFTYGEDYKMMYELGFDIILFGTMIFTALLASISVNEDIEGRTALTLLSKPLSRRDFLLGKFIGINLSGFLLLFGLGTVFQLFLLFRQGIERIDPLPDAPWILDLIETLGLGGSAEILLKALAGWFFLTAEVAPSIVLCFCQVTIITAIAVALATRFPMMVTLPVIATIFFLAHLAPVLVSTSGGESGSSGAGVAQMLRFTVTAFHAILPDLELFRVNIAILGDTQLTVGSYWLHVAWAVIYAAIYASVPLLVGLVLFEGRDLG